MRGAFHPLSLNRRSVCASYQRTRDNDRYSKTSVLSHCSSPSLSTCGCVFGLLVANTWFSLLTVLAVRPKPIREFVHVILQTIYLLRHTVCLLLCVHTYGHTAKEQHVLPFCGTLVGIHGKIPHTNAIPQKEDVVD